jgi:hypothetical protein
MQSHCKSHVGRQFSSFANLPLLTEALLEASGEVGVLVNTEKSMRMVNSRSQNAGQSHNLQIANNPLKMWQSSELLGMTVTNQN